MDKNQKERNKQMWILSFEFLNHSSWIELYIWDTNCNNDVGLKIRMVAPFSCVLVLLWITQVVMRALSSPPFGNYRVWWSLADSKYAGTALLVKKCFKPKKISFSLDTAGFSWISDTSLFTSLLLIDVFIHNYMFYHLAFWFFSYCFAGLQCMMLS